MLKCFEFEKWMEGKSDEELGALLREYVRESNHSGWDGWPFRRLRGGIELLMDMKRYKENSVW